MSKGGGFFTTIRGKDKSPPKKVASEGGGSVGISSDPVSPEALKRVEGGIDARIAAARASLAGLGLPSHLPSAPPEIASARTAVRRGRKLPPAPVAAGGARDARDAVAMRPVAAVSGVVDLKAKAKVIKDVIYNKMMSERGILEPHLDTNAYYQIREMIRGLEAGAFSIDQLSSGLLQSSVSKGRDFLLTASGAGDNLKLSTNLVRRLYPIVVSLERAGRFNLGSFIAGAELLAKDSRNHCGLNKLSGKADDDFKKTAKLFITEENLAILHDFFEERKGVNDKLGNLYNIIKFEDFILRLMNKRYKEIYLDGRALVGRDDAPLPRFDSDVQAREFMNNLATKGDANNYYQEYLTPEEMMLAPLVLPQAASLIIGTGNRSDQWGAAQVYNEFIQSVDVALLSYPAAAEYRDGRTASYDLLFTTFFNGAVDRTGNHDKTRKQVLQENKALMKAAAKIYGANHSLSGNRVTLEPMSARHRKGYVEMPHQLNIAAYKARTKNTLKLILLAADHDMEKYDLGTTFSLKGVGMGAFSFTGSGKVFEQLTKQALQEVMGEITLSHIKKINLISWPSVFRSVKDERERAVYEGDSTVKGVKVVESNRPESLKKVAGEEGVAATVYCGDSGSLVGNEGNIGLARGSSDDPAMQYSMYDPQLMDPYRNHYLNQAEAISIVNDRGEVCSIDEALAKLGRDRRVGSRGEGAAVKKVGKTGGGWFRRRGGGSEESAKPAISAPADFRRVDDALHLESLAKYKDNKEGLLKLLQYSWRLPEGVEKEIKEAFEGYKTGKIGDTKNADVRRSFSNQIKAALVDRLEVLDPDFKDGYYKIVPLGHRIEPAQYNAVKLGVNKFLAAEVVKSPAGGRAGHSTGGGLGYVAAEDYGARGGRAGYDARGGRAGHGTRGDRAGHSTGGGRGCVAAAGYDARGGRGYVAAAGYDARGGLGYVAAEGRGARGVSARPRPGFDPRPITASSAASSKPPLPIKVSAMNAFGQRVKYGISGGIAPEYTAGNVCIIDPANTTTLQGQYNEASSLSGAIYLQVTGDNIGDVTIFETIKARNYPEVMKRVTAAQPAVNYTAKVGGHQFGVIHAVAPHGGELKGLTATYVNIFRCIAEAADKYTEFRIPKMAGGVFAGGSDVPKNTAIAVSNALGIVQSEGLHLPYDKITLCCGTQDSKMAVERHLSSLKSATPSRSVISRA